MPSVFVYRVLFIEMVHFGTLWLSAFTAKHAVNLNTLTDEECCVSSLVYERILAYIFVYNLMVFCAFQ